MKTAMIVLSTLFTWFFAMGEVMSFLAFNTPGMFYYGVGLILSSQLLKIFLRWE